MAIAGDIIVAKSARLVIQLEWSDPPFTGVFKANRVFTQDLAKSV